MTLERTLYYKQWKTKEKYFGGAICLRSHHLRLLECWTHPQPATRLKTYLTRLIFHALYAIRIQLQDYTQTANIESYVFSVHSVIYYLACKKEKFQDVLSLPARLES